MIGRLNTNDRRVTVVGAGISGLLIGYALKKRGYQVSIHEKSDRCGGLIQTKHTDHGMVETAAHSILVNQTVRDFFDELGVELIPLKRDSKARFIYRDGKMRKMPLTLREAASTLAHFFRKPNVSIPLQDLTLEQWGNAYLGPAASRFLLSPFVTGIFASSPAELNAGFSFPKLVPASPDTSLFQHFRSLKKRSQQGPPRMMALKHGTEDLVTRLQHVLKNEIHLHSPIQGLNSIEGNIVLCVPLNVLAELLSPAVQDLPHSPLLTATVFIPKRAFQKKPPRGVGVLIPRGEQLRMLGCLFNSSAFEGRVTDKNEVSLTVMYGGTADPSALHFSDLELQSLIQEELGQLLGVRHPASYIDITRWQRAIPIYSTALKRATELLSKGFCSTPGRLIFANYSGQISIRGMIESTQGLDASGHQ